MKAKEGSSPPWRLRGPCTHVHTHVCTPAHIHKGTRVRHPHPPTYTHAHGCVNQHNVLL